MLCSLLTSRAITALLSGIFSLCGTDHEVIVRKLSEADDVLSVHSKKKEPFHTLPTQKTEDEHLLSSVQKAFYMR